MILTVTDRTGAGRLLWRGEVDYLISIGGDDRLPSAFNKAPHRLRLVFDDIDGESMASIMAGYVPPSEEDIRKIADFGRRVPEGARLLIHCAAGISRSTAAGMIVLMARGMTYFEALQEVKRIRPQARPNALMLAIWEGMR